jgi:hypothetical protein
MKNLSHEMAEAFLRWPLPGSVCADHCTTYPIARYNAMLQRTGTNLLSYVEAKKMIDDIVLPILERENARLLQVEKIEYENRGEIQHHINRCELPWGTPATDDQPEMVGLIVDELIKEKASRRDEDKNGNHSERAAKLWETLASWEGEDADAQLNIEHALAAAEEYGRQRVFTDNKLIADNAHLRAENSELLKRIHTANLDLSIARAHKAEVEKERADHNLASLSHDLRSILTPRPLESLVQAADRVVKDRAALRGTINAVLLAIKETGEQYPNLETETWNCVRQARLELAKEAGK